MAETAELSGLPLSYIEADWRALGLSMPAADQPTSTDRNIAALNAIAAMRDAGISEAQLLELTRMVGDASARLADAVLRTFADALLRLGDSERDLGLRLAELGDALMPHLGEMLRGPFELHLVEMLKREAVTSLERERGFVPGARPVAVCFADMVGFTRLSEQLDMDGLAQVTQRFSEMTADCTEPPVRLVKTIGDEAMLASEDAGALVDMSLRLIDAAARDDLLPPLHAGAAAGPALRRSGDWYGRPVNLAARIAAVAPPGGLMADTGLRAAAGDGFAWAPAGRRSFKGIEGDVELFAAAGAGAGAPD
jgi:adenylate cyclase